MSMSLGVLSLISKDIIILMYLVSFNYLEEIQLVDFVEIKLIQLFAKQPFGLHGVDKGIPEVVEPHNICLFSLDH